MNRLRKWMIGRYGYDELSSLILILALVAAVVYGYTKIQVFYIISVLLIVGAYYRIFSKDIARRTAEKQKYLMITKPIRAFFQKNRDKVKNRKTHTYFRCPKCKKELRIPRGKGKVEVTCPNCHETFIKSS